MMIPPIAATLPATVQFVGPWTEEARAQVITTLTPLIPALPAPWTLTYERDTLGTGKYAATAEGYSAAVERDCAAQRVIARCWDLGMYLRQLAAYVRTQAEGQAAPTRNRSAAAR